MGLPLSYEEVPTAEVFYIQRGDGPQHPSDVGVNILYFHLRAGIHPLSCFSAAHRISWYARPNELVLLRETWNFTCDLSSGGMN